MSVDDGLRRLHDHLEATEERPVGPAAGRWLGEAAAVAADLVDAVVAARVERVLELPAEVGTTGNEAVDERVAAERAADDVRSSVEGE